MKPYLFLHIPKTGGTSINNVLPRGRTTMESVQRCLEHRHPPMTNAGAAKPHHYTLEQYESSGISELEGFNDLYTFTFVRNPWDRVVSLYNHWKTGSRIAYGPYESEMIRRRLGTISSNDEPIEDFQWFIRRITEIVLNKEYYFANNGHFTPQIKYTHDSEGTQLVDFIGRYETLTEDFRKLNEICGWALSEIEIPHLNKSNKKYKEYRDYYYDGNGVAKTLVKEIYGPEIELYGYKF